MDDRSKRGGSMVEMGGEREVGRTTRVFYSVMMMALANVNVSLIHYLHAC